MAIALSVNLNKIALLRNSRDGDFPNVADFGRRALEYGANGLTVHPRPDQRHIRPGDTRELAALTRKFPAAEFNIEGNPFAPAQDTYPGLVSLALETRPDQCTLVPDSDSQKTSDHGFDLTVDGDKLIPIIETLKANKIRVSLFMDPVIEQIHLAKEVGADRIELYTGPFAWAFDAGSDRAEAEFMRHKSAAEYALKIGLEINAGHDLNLKNMVLYNQLPGLKEVSIGHALTVDALNMGFEKTINAYLALCA